MKKPDVFTDSLYSMNTFGINTKHTSTKAKRNTKCYAIYQRLLLWAFTRWRCLLLLLFHQTQWTRLHRLLMTLVLVMEIPLKALARDRPAATSHSRL